MKKQHEIDDSEYNADETARRRDEVIRRMANTPPQPKITSSRHPKRKKRVAGDRVIDKGRARREG
jgi:hypothetical protein